MLDTYAVVQIYAIILFLMSCIAGGYMFYEDEESYSGFAGILVAMVLAIVGMTVMLFGDQVSDSEIEYGEPASVQLEQFSRLTEAKEELREKAADEVSDAYAYHYDNSASNANYTSNMYIVVVPETDGARTYQAKSMNADRTSIEPLADGENTPYVEVRSRTKVGTGFLGREIVKDDGFEYVLHIDDDMMVSGANKAVYNIVHGKLDL